MQPLWPQGCLLRGENATLALNHLTHSCRASLWEGFLHNMKPDPSRWACCCVTPLVGGFHSSFSPLPIGRSVNTLPQTCAYMSIQPMQKKTSVTCRHLLKHLDSWIPTPHWGVHGNQRHSSAINAMPLRKTVDARTKCCGVLIDISLHSYQTLLFHVSRQQSSDLIGNRYDRVHVCLSKESKRQKERKLQYVCMCAHAWKCVY